MKGWIYGCKTIHLRQSAVDTSPAEDKIPAFTFRDAKAISAAVVSSAGGGVLLQQDGGGRPLLNLPRHQSPNLFHT